MKILIGILFVLLLISSYLLYHQNSTIENKNYKLVQTLQVLEFRTEEVGDLESRTLNALKLNGKKIEVSEVKLLQFEDTIRMKALLGSKTLVYKFSFADCQECINKHLSLLANIVSKDPPINVIVLMQYDHARNYRFLANQFPTLKIFGINKDFPITEQSLFTIDLSGITNDYYLPQTTSEKLSERYLSMMLDKAK
jgi:uncharacterized protein YxeA